MKATAADLRRVLLATPRATSATLCAALNGINRSTLNRIISQIDAEVIHRGGSRRTRYALRRDLRGRQAPMPLYRVDISGAGHLVGQLDLTAPEGSALTFSEPFAWPLDDDDLMRDGWFDSLPYPLLDMRPQGFLGRNFAHRYWQQLDVPENLTAWSDDDIIEVLTTYGHDQGGDLILGDRAYQQHLDDRSHLDSQLIHTSEVPKAYPEQAMLALSQGIVGSSAGGEFPKFTTMRDIDGTPVAVIVKFSGTDNSASVRRWSDLLVAEHLALATLSSELSVSAAVSDVYQHGGRTFLEVRRFDRCGAHGRRPLCSLASVNHALLGKAGASWPTTATLLANRGALSEEAVHTVKKIWWFGKLIANTDMHDGNLSFHPGLTVAPAYDMLPMRYAPLRGGEVPAQAFAAALPLPTDVAVWRAAADAARVYWHRCASDTRIGTGFRNICLENAGIVARAMDAV